MPRIIYTERKFKPDALGIIAQANNIIAAYQAQGFQLTLRQLYYQFVSRDLIKNRQQEYKRLGSIINDARLAGYIDWEAIVDRTRNLEDLAHWSSPQEILDAVAKQYRTERWESQPRRVEVWIEKDALIGVIEGVCQGLDVPYFSCRGYTSQSEIWGAAQRLGKHIANGQAVTILHMGDHDPSGMDMTRDITDRLKLFIAQDWENDHDGYQLHDEADREDAFDAMDEHVASVQNGMLDRPVFEVKRIALNWDQIQQYNPPPNFAKVTDSRARGYIDAYGTDSWELDALEPTVLAGLITDNVTEIIEPEAWAEASQAMDLQKAQLRGVARDWDTITETMEVES